MTALRIYLLASVSLINGQIMSPLLFDLKIPNECNELYSQIITGLTKLMYIPKMSSSSVCFSNLITIFPSSGEMKTTKVDPLLFRIWQAGNFVNCSIAMNEDKLCIPLSPIHYKRSCINSIQIPIRDLAGNSIGDGEIDDTVTSSIPGRWKEYHATIIYPFSEINPTSLLYTASKEKCITSSSNPLDPNPAISKGCEESSDPEACKKQNGISPDSSTSKPAPTHSTSEKPQTTTSGTHSPSSSTSTSSTNPPPNPTTSAEKPGSDKPTTTSTIKPPLSTTSPPLTSQTNAPTKPTTIPQTSLGTTTSKKPYTSTTPSSPSDGKKVIDDQLSFNFLNFWYG